MKLSGYSHKKSVVVVFTGDGKGKTSASLGLMIRALGTGWKVAYIQFIKLWDVGEHQFINDITTVYKSKLDFYKGGQGFYKAGKLSADASEKDHIVEAKRTYDFALDAVTSGKYQLVVCDEINNAVNDGLLTMANLERLIDDKHPNTNLCLTGRNFPTALIKKVDIATEMKKLKHHFDDKLIANKGIDY